MPSSLDRDAYCRALEAYLCRKNDGHLIRIVGPAFERVMSWAEQGIPLKVAEAGIDRYFERYYRKGPRRRPVRLEFCEADILDAFDDWRRAVGVALVGPDPSGGPMVEEPVPGPVRPRRSLRVEIEGAMARLTVIRSRAGGADIPDRVLETAIRGLDALRHRAEGARGEERQSVIEAAAAVGERLAGDILGGLPAPDREALANEARRELEPFRARMPEDAYQRAMDAAVSRLIRERFRLPELQF
jgi:hypothetical protein